jgi:hypothetical protein
MIESPAKTASISRTENPPLVNPVSDEKVVPSSEIYGARLLVVVFEFDCKNTFTTSVGIENVYEKGM